VHARPCIARILPQAIELGEEHVGKWSIRQRILGSFGLILALMIAMAGVAYHRLTAIAHDTQILRIDSMPGLHISSTLQANWFENFLAAQRLMIADNDPDSIRRDKALVESSQRDIEQAIHDYEATIFDQDDRAHMNAIKTIETEYVTLQRSMLDQLASARPAALQIYNERYLPLWETGRTSLRTLVDENHRQSQMSTDNIKREAITAEIALFTAVVIAFIAALVTGTYLMRAITRPMAVVVETLDAMRSGDLTQRLNLSRNDEFAVLEAGFNRMAEELTALVGHAQKSSTQVALSVSEIASTSKEQQATASETAATTTEIGATSREIHATARDLVRTMSEVSSVSDQTADLANAGQSGLTRMEETMDQVMAAAGAVNAKLAILNEKASNINQVVATITKVADQTNLLSLNAAIEAEKAGEYGRGFSVVATEIRRLADQTSIATYDIEQTVKEIQSAVSAGVMGMDKFSEEVRRGMVEVQQVGGQLSQVIHQVQTLAPRFQLVNEGMQAQATGAEQITQALTQLSEAAQQTVESLHQSNQTIDDLTLVANGLRTGVSRFNVQTLGTA
jgi:methyl-accepting chemotaxis protein WspA